MEVQTTSEGRSLLVQDAAGEYYLIPGPVVEQYRVPSDRKKEIDEILRNEQDVTGYSVMGPHSSVLIDNNTPMMQAIRAAWLSMSILTSFGAMPGDQGNAHEKITGPDPGAPPSSIRAAQNPGPATF